MTFVIFLKKIFFGKQYWILNKSSSAIMHKKSLSYTIPKRLHMIFLFSVGGHVEVVLKDGVGLNRSPHGPGTCHTERERYYVLVNWYSVLYWPKQHIFHSVNKNSKTFEMPLIVLTVSFLPSINCRCCCAADTTGAVMLLPGPSCCNVSCAAGIWAVLPLSGLCCWHLSCVAVVYLCCWFLGLGAVISAFLLVLQCSASWYLNQAIGVLASVADPDDFWPDPDLAP